jgi:hypothetical protein
LAPAGGSVSTRSESSGASFKPGQFVRATIDNTAFFSKRPKGDGDADKLLARDTQMKVISSDSSYVKVELDSGEVGFVPTVMVNDPSSVAAAPGSNAVQVYPPVGPTGGIEPLPTFDTSELPPPGAIPPIIPVDPNAPAPLPAGTNAPATPGGAPPLPPGIDDVTPSKPEEKKTEAKPAESPPATPETPATSPTPPAGQ